MKQPRKPTSPFGTIVFGKDGSVRRQLFKLPETKAAQEIAVASRFAALLRKFHGLEVSEPTALQERGHDAALLIDGSPIQLQLTEISPREFTLPMGSPNKGDSKAIAFFSATSTFATSLDVEAANDSLANAIQRKLEMHYTQETNSGLWLLVFTTSPFLTMEFFQDGELKIGEPLRRARAHFNPGHWAPFHEVWFSDLQSRPVRILPHQAQPD